MEKLLFTVKPTTLSSYLENMFNIYLSLQGLCSHLEMKKSDSLPGLACSSAQPGSTRPAGSSTNHRLSADSLASRLKEVSSSMGGGFNPLLASLDQPGKLFSRSCTYTEILKKWKVGIPLCFNQLFRYTFLYIYDW